MNQQIALVKKHACFEYLEGLDKIEFPVNHIPAIEDISERLYKSTGWSLKPVEKIIPCPDFFNLLAEKKFPTVRKIRPFKEIDFYTDESPDVFHEYFGHCPLLTNKKYAESMEMFGTIAMGKDPVIIHALNKIFWVTFEFGIIKNRSNVKVYGAGILPSRLELVRVTNKYQEELVFKKLNIYQELHSSLQGNINQQIFYYINSMDDLFKIVAKKLPKLVNSLIENGKVF